MFKLLVYFLVPLGLNSLNLACGGLSSSGNAQSTGLAVGEIPNDAPIPGPGPGNNQVTGGPGIQNTDPAVPGDPLPGAVAAAAPGRGGPISGPVAAANGPVPGSQSTDSGVPTGLMYFLFAQGQVLSSGAPDGDTSCQNFNDTLKVTRWILTYQDKWLPVKDVPVDPCGKFSEFGVAVPATHEDRPFIKYVATIEVMGRQVTTETEVPAGKGTGNVILRFPVTMIINPETQEFQEPVRDPKAIKFENPTRFPERIFQSLTQ